MQLQSTGNLEEVKALKVQEPIVLVKLYLMSNDSKHCLLKMPCDPPYRHGGSK